MVFFFFMFNRIFTLFAITSILENNNNGKLEETGHPVIESESELDASSEIRGTE